MQLSFFECNRLSVSIGQPKLWSRTQDEHSNGPDIGATSPSAFELLLLGETAAGGSLNIPKSLKGIVRKTGSASQSKVS